MNNSGFLSRLQIAFTIVILGITFGAYDGALSPVFAQNDFIIYPKDGQSQEQQEKDKFECYSWGKKQTGFDPMETPRVTEAPPQKEAQRGGAVKGGVGGALLGAAIGSISGGSKGARKGAAIGGISGGVLGGARSQDQRRQEEHAAQQWERDQANQYAQKRNSYNRAYAVCLEGRGYTVR
jgi:hypothetical protein